MSARHLQRLKAIDTWRRRPVYRARIVNADTAAIIVKSARSVGLGRRISFARLSECDGNSPANWSSAVIWRIEDNCIHLTRT